MDPKPPPQLLKSQPWTFFEQAGTGHGAKEKECWSVRLPASPFASHVGQGHVLLGPVPAQHLTVVALAKGQLPQLCPTGGVLHPQQGRGTMPGPGMSCVKGSLMALLLWC